MERTGATPVRESQQWQAAVREKAAALARDTLAISVAEKQVDVLNAELANASATLAQRQAACIRQNSASATRPLRRRSTARLEIALCASGNTYKPGPSSWRWCRSLSAVYVTANYKETQLTDVRPGQKVTIVVDTFSGETVHGVVDSIAPASGEEFALLPPDNATDNFTKIVERIPVKIAIDPHDPLLGALRPGMSVEPTIDTRISPGRDAPWPMYRPRRKRWFRRRPGSRSAGR